MYYFTILSPEIILMIASLLFVTLGAFISDANRAYVTIYSMTLAVFVVTLLVVIWQFQWFFGQSHYLFEGQYVLDNFASYAKILILAGAAVILLMSAEEFLDNGMNQFEFPTLVLLAVLGMMVMVSANHLMTLYVGLELQSLSLYIMVAFRRDSIRESEAGLKYFILGALASAILLYGISLVYGFAGDLHFQSIAQNLRADDVNIGAVVGIAFVIAGIAFKLSVVPFHMWTPDVYEGATTPVTAFFAAVPKIAAFVLFIRVLMVSFEAAQAYWQMLLMVIAMLSMVLGAFAAIAQQKIKRLIAYSAIGHMGYALMGLTAGTQEGIIAVMIYLPIYLVTIIGLFACVLMLRTQQGSVENITDLSGLLKTAPMVSVVLLIFMFSMAGIPPLAGFFAKFYVFRAALQEQLIIMVVFAALTSVVSAFYYLRIIRLMFFDTPKISHHIKDTPVLRITMLTSAGLVALLALWPAPLVHLAQAAAAALFRGI